MARSSDPGVQLCKDIPREANRLGSRVSLRANENAREKRLAALDRGGPKMARARRPGFAQPAPGDAEGKLFLLTNL
jgi:hypothetical protein